MLAVLNSKVGNWYIRHLGVTRNGGYFEYKPMFVEQLPIPQVSQNVRERFISIVNRIHENKSTGYSTNDLEWEIDKMVFDLYGLKENEISFILAE